MLEAMLLSHGYSDQAKRVFFAHKEAERGDMLRRNRWEDDKLSWAYAQLLCGWDFLREWLVGYGKSLQLPFVVECSVLLSRLSRISQ
jgi:hypothetical protein